MYSALYYPHTTVQSPALLRSALLLWDELHVIVPWQDFPFEKMARDERRALELIVRRRVPTPAEQKAAHEFIEDFATRPLPAAFSYRDDIPEPYELYPQKLMPETWQLLQDADLVGEQDMNEIPARTETGLSIMSILADCCAGSALARVTDQEAAYAVLSDVVVLNQRDAIAHDAPCELTTVPLRVAAAENIPLEKLIALREREAAGKAPGVVELRHRLVDRMNEQADRITAAKGENDRNELQRQFEEFLAADLRDLREALKLETTEALSSKVVVASVLGAAGALAATLPAFSVPLSGVAMFPVLKAVTGWGAIGGLINTKAKFAKTRMKVLKEHPAAYLYEAFGGRLRY